MPISTFYDPGGGAYVPKGLPLQGSNYQISIAHQSVAKQKQITKAGNQIAVRCPNPADNVDLQVRPDGFSYSQGNQLPTDVFENGHSVLMRRPNGQSVQITMNGNSIAVDRPGFNGDVLYTQTPTGLDIDRFGTANDVRITRGSQGVDFQYGQPLNNTRVSLSPGLELDTVAYQDEVTLHPHALSILDHWFSQGKVEASDLITLTQKGEIAEWDGLLR